jgi:group I intron endonuclease
MESKDGDISLDYDIKNEPGIYEIHNKINDKRYIGQSIHVRARVLKHISQLNKNEHQNNHLQYSWNKYGEENFEVNVLEYCSVEVLDEKEDYYIMQYQSNNNQYGFNYRIDNKTNRGLKWSDEQREKMMDAIDRNPWFRNHTVPLSTAQKAWETTRNRVWTQEERKRHSEILTGTKVSDTSKMKLAQQGEGNPSCKLSEESVKEIILLLQNEYCSIELLSCVYCVTTSNIRMIRCNRSWKHIDRNNIEEKYFLLGVKKVDEYSRKHKEEITNCAI